MAAAATLGTGKMDGHRGTFGGRISAYSATGTEKLQMAGLSTHRRIAASPPGPPGRLRRHVFY
ncbi:hypothetical protein [Luteibacter sp. CQ10]|uniref:hypothetical protein n=1 Tax=Luteibacter sp. CQ10 TaxID=2805821 RepID=UPI0034A26781